MTPTSPSEPETEALPHAPMAAAALPTGGGARGADH
jgi:hypothetical protein